MINLREYFKKWPAFYFFIAAVFGPTLLTGLSPRGFLRRFPRPGKTLNIGSGPHKVGADVINVDIERYPGVSVIAEACAVPFPDGSISRIISNTVLEHVQDPIKAVAEMDRLLEKGGVAYVAIPFLYPFHSSPSDYQRWSPEAVKVLFQEFEIIEMGVRAGPFSALDAYLCHLTGLLFSFGSEWLDSLITNLAMFLFFPIKYLDMIFAHWPRAENMAAVLYCVVRKK